MTFSLAGVRCLARNVDAADPASPRATSPRSRVEAGPPLPHNRNSGARSDRSGTAA